MVVKKKKKYPIERFWKSVLNFWVLSWNAKNSRSILTSQKDRVSIPSPLMNIPKTTMQTEWIRAKSCLSKSQWLRKTVTDFRKRQSRTYRGQNNLRGVRN